jgi:hypothetical protein
MAVKQKKVASNLLGIKSLPIHDEASEVTDLAMAVAETITDKLKRSLLKQSELVDVLTQDHPWKTRLSAVSELIVTMKEMISSVPKIHSAVVYATKAGWKIGSVRAVSSQNTLNINIRHAPSRMLMKEMKALWATGKWKYKTSCVEDNYERLMREVGLWDDDKVTQKPNFESVLRRL